MERFPSSVHSIRLRGPWDFAWLTDESTPPSGETLGTLRLPVSWFDAFGDVDGVVRLTRTFNRPTGLDDGERVWIEVATPTTASIAFGGNPLGRMEPGTARFDVTDRIEPQSCVELEIERRDAARRDEPLVEVEIVIESFD